MEFTSLSPAINTCVRLNLPFAVYAMPGDKDFTLLCSKPDADTGENNLEDTTSDEPYFQISLFNNDNPYPIGITGSLSISDIASLATVSDGFDDADIRPVNKSTSEILYRAQLHEIESKLRHNNGKIVLSRVIAGESQNTDVADIANRYFSKHPDTLRFLFFTQETGLWLGATPELLLDFNCDNGHFSTMSLAGTRNSGEKGTTWDDKNSEEQRMVTDFIIESLNDAKAENVVKHPVHDLAFGDISHRCTIISGQYEGDPYDLIYNLSPTPAVSGYPRKAALDAIYSLEAHPRNCYAGFVAVNNPARHSLSAYVNLRCAFLRPEKDRLIYNVFAGGGITRKSTPDEEWHETEAKSANLIGILNNFNFSPSN